jgi:hypothetical protein
MNNRLKAAISTAKILALGTMAMAIALLITDYFSREQIITTLQISVIVFIVYMIYSINLSNLEVEDALSKINKDKK